MIFLSAEYFDKKVNLLIVNYLIISRSGEMSSEFCVKICVFRFFEKSFVKKVTDVGVYVLFLPTAARKVRKEKPLKGERAYDSVAERLGLKD